MNDLSVLSSFLESIFSPAIWHSSKKRRLRASSLDPLQRNDVGTEKGGDREEEAEEGALH